MPVPPDVVDVLRAFAIDMASVTPLDGGLSGAVWKVEADGRRYVLRRHDGSGDMVVLIHSELALLDALGEQSTVRVPVPVRRADGVLAPVTGNAPDGTASTAWTLVHWVDGTTLGRLPDPVEAALTGSMLAELHQQGRRWSPPAWFQRPTFDAGYFERMASVLFDRVGERIDAFDLADLRTALPPSLDALDRLMNDRTEVGLIHADVHDGNVVFGDGHDEPGLIDFARCGVGCWALDLAMAMHYLTEDLAIPLVAAYTATFDLSSSARQALPVLRFLAGIENLAILSAIPDEMGFIAAELPEFAGQARSLGV